MNLDSETPLVIGDPVRLRVQEFQDKPVFEAHFVFYDFELQSRDLQKRGIREDDYDERDDFLYNEYEPPDFRSVRIFHLAMGEEIKLENGDRIRGTIQYVRVGKDKTKDGRRKVHITVKNAMRIYHWIRDRNPHLVITLLCGTREIRQKIISLQMRKGVDVQNGRTYPILAETLPNGSILHAYPDTMRPRMTTGDYRLQERQKGRTMQDIDKDFMRVLPYDRIIPTRQRRYVHLSNV